MTETLKKIDEENIEISETIEIKRVHQKQILIERKIKLEEELIKINNYLKVFDEKI